MFGFQSVRRSFPRNLAENSESASFLGQTTSYKTEVQERETWAFYEWITCNEKPRYEIIRLLLCFFSGLYFPPKHSGENIRSASGFFIAGNPFVKSPGFPFLHFRLISLPLLQISKIIPKQIHISGGKK